MLIPKRKTTTDDFDAEHFAENAEACILEYCNMYGLDIQDYKTRSTLRHNEINSILLYIYHSLLEPIDKHYRHSIVNYSDIDELSTCRDVFLSICLFFNKALGVYSFSLMSGIHSDTLDMWAGGGASPEHAAIVKSIQEYDTNAIIASLKDSTLGQIAVANNDERTGLKWSRNTAPQIQGASVFYIPSERVDKLRLESGGG